MNIEKDTVLLKTVKVKMVGGSAFIALPPTWRNKNSLNSWDDIDCRERPGYDNQLILVIPPREIK